MSKMSLGFSSNGPVALGAVKVPPKYFNRFGTGIESIDNMFGDNGFIKGQTITLAAMRGAGKTTAMLQVLNGVMANDKRKKCIYLSGEEYVEQLAFTAMRIDTPLVLADNVTDIDEIAKLTKTYDIIVIDSLASLTTEKLTGTSKDVYAVNTINKAAHENDCVVVFILHMTKDGKSKGNSMIEHTVDTCITLYNVDSEEYGELNCKAFCIDKNRFGMTKDSIFRMTAAGWDFANPIREDYDKDKSKSQSRADKKQAEMDRILEAIKGSKRFMLKDLQKLTDDVKVYERYTRHLTSMVKMGTVKKSGRGAAAIYKVAN